MVVRKNIKKTKKKTQTQNDNVIYTKDNVLAVFIETLVFMQESCILKENDIILFIKEDNHLVINIQTNRFVTRTYKNGTQKTYSFSTVEDRLNRFPKIFYSVLIGHDVVNKRYNHIIKFTNKEYYEYVIEYLSNLNERLENRIA